MMWSEAVLFVPHVTMLGSEEGQAKGLPLERKKRGRKGKQTTS